MFSLLITALLAQASPATINKKVEVNGHTYRVFVRQGEVKVFNKSAFQGIGGGRSVARRAEMRQAVELATGCEMKDDFWRNHILAGELSCSSE